MPQKRGSEWGAGVSLPGLEGGGASPFREFSKRWTMVDRQIWGTQIAVLQVSPETLSALGKPAKATS